MANKRILVLTLSFGTGHVMASVAIDEAIRKIDPKAEVRLLDCLRFSSAWFRALYVWPYWMMIRFAPSLWARLFKARHTQQHRQTAPHWLFRWGCRQVFDEIKRWQPDVLVATEVGACEMAAMAKRRHITPAPLLAVMTDYESEPVWMQPEVNQFFVPTVEVAGQLAQWGVDRRQIVVSGIPLLSRFHRVERSHEDKERLGLLLDRPMVLVMGGGMGPLRMDQIVRELTGLPQPLSIVAVAGRNLKMQEKLELLRAQSNSKNSLVVYGWVDHVDELMRAADVLVTKPGGLTFTEAASLGVFLVCINPIPGPEEIHCRLIEREKLGVVVESIAEVGVKVAQVINTAPSKSARPAPGWLKRDAAERIAMSALENAIWLLACRENKVESHSSLPSTVPLESEQLLLKSYESEFSSQ